MASVRYRNIIGQFYVLFWKNILLEIRYWPSLSIGAILSYVVVIFLIRYLDIADEVQSTAGIGNDTRSMNPTLIDIHLRSRAYAPYSYIFLAYAPSCPATDKLMTEVKLMLIRNGLPANVKDSKLSYARYKTTQFRLTYE